MRRSTCTSALALLLAGSAAARAASADLVKARTLELEAGLAKTTAIYLYFDPSQRVLEVRSRGMTLDRAALQSVMMLHHDPLFGRDDQPEPEVPGLWTVDQGPGDLSREVIAPDALKPYVPEDQRQETPITPQAAKPIPLPPAEYVVPLTNGWSFAILDREPRAGFLHRYARAVKDGWARLWGTEIVRPPLVALTMSTADAQRFHHVFRSQLPVLVAAGGG